jgi:hypothetical protein
LLEEDEGEEEEEEEEEEELAVSVGRRITWKSKLHGCSTSNSRRGLG